MFSSQLQSTSYRACKHWHSYHASLKSGLRCFRQHLLVLSGVTVHAARSVHAVCSEPRLLWRCTLPHEWAARNDSCLSRVCFWINVWSLCVQKPLIVAKIFSPFNSFYLILPCYPLSNFCLFQLLFFPVPVAILYSLMRSTVSANPHKNENSNLYFVFWIYNL